jgi:hypothetical protein
MRLTLYPQPWSSARSRSWTFRWVPTIFGIDAVEVEVPDGCQVDPRSDTLHMEDDARYTAAEVLRLAKMGASSRWRLVETP